MIIPGAKGKAFERIVMAIIKPDAPEVNSKTGVAFKGVNSKHTTINLISPQPSTVFLYPSSMVSFIPINSAAITNDSACIGMFVNHKLHATLSNNMSGITWSYMSIMHIQIKEQNNIACPADE